MRENIRLYENNSHIYDMLEYTKLYPHLSFFSLYQEHEHQNICNLKEEKISEKKGTIINEEIQKMFVTRQSSREFNNILTKKIVNSILYYAVHSDKRERRAFPSAGALYSNILYVNISNVCDMKSGLYYFDYFRESLIYIGKHIESNEMKELLLKQDFAENAKMVVFFVANMKLIKEKYGNRGERYVILDAGHISQNFYLIASAVGVSTVSVGGFLDDYVSKRLMLNDTLKPVYVQCFG